MDSQIKDPALYRIYAFLLEDLEQDSKSFINSVLPSSAKAAKLRYQEPSNKPQNRKIVYLWDQDRELDEGGYLHGLARSYDADAVVFLGLEDVHDAEIDGWLDKDAHHLKTILEAFEKQTKLFRRPTDEQKDERLLLLGQAWVYTAEWETPPATWRDFARERYQQGGYALFDWGVMGFCPESEWGRVEEYVPRFELHVDLKHKRQRDDFLFGAFMVIAANFIKVTQTIGERYQESYHRKLRGKAEETDVWVGSSSVLRVPDNNTVLSHSSPSGTKNEHKESGYLFTLENSAFQGARIVNEYALLINNLSMDAHTVQTNIRAVKDLLNSSQAKISEYAPSHFLNVEMNIILEQMLTDLVYFELVEKQAREQLDLLQLKVSIRRARLEYRLVLIGISLGAIVGLGQVLTGLSADSHWRVVTIGLITFMFIYLGYIFIKTLWEQRAKE